MLRKRKGLFLLVGAVVALILGATAILNHVNKKEAAADTGSVTYYQQYTNGTTTVGQFQVNGSDAWCAEHDKTSLPWGTSVSTLSGYPRQVTSSSSYADQMMYKAMYYGVQGGYGTIPITMVVSYVYTGGRSPASFYGSHHDTGNSLTAQNLYDYISSAPLPSGTLTLYLWQTGSTTYQVLSQYAYEANQTVTVTKVWKDNSNAYGTRPTSVRFHFYVNDSYVGYYDLSGTGDTWSQTMSLGAGTVTISEDTPTGYSSSVNGLTITNTLTDTTSVPVTKVWSDSNNADGSRPANIQIQLLRNGSAYQTATVTGSSTGAQWTHTFGNLPKYDVNGVLYTYTVAEPTVPSGYTRSQSGNTITNSHTPEVTSVTFTKYWRDNSNAYNTRPATLEIELLQDGIVIDTRSINGTGNTWTYTYSGLDKYDGNHNEFSYRVREKSTPSGYTAAPNGNSVTNTLTGTTSITATKVWDDYNNADNTRPASIQIQLLRNGTVYDTATLNGSGNTWTKTWSNLDKYDGNGALYVYTVAESTVPTGYTRSQDGNTITNTYRAETSISVTKNWRDNSNAYSTRPGSIEIEILQNGNVYQTKTLNGSGNTWSATYAGLPKYDNNNNAYTYTIREKTTPSGYASSQNGTTITNTLTGTTSITATKIWNDYGNADNTRPTSIDIQLLRNGVAIDTVTLTTADSSVLMGNSWTKTWDNLPKYDANGVEYNYSVSEPTVPDSYTKTQAGNTIVNTYTATTEASVTKVWSDWGNRYSMRPGSVSIDLLRNGTVLKTVTVNGSGDTWTHTERNLEKYDTNGNAYTYTWRETSVPENYAMTQNGNTITNKLDVKISVPVTKIWKDNNNAYNTRPDKIMAQLFRNNAFMGIYGLYESNGWHAVAENLDKYDANGNEYTYTWSEERGAPSGYVEVDGANTITNTLTGYTSIQIQKIWKDNNNKYFTRPSNVTFEVLQNGSVYSTVTVNGAGNTWSRRVDSLPKYDSEGVEYSYTVREVNVPNGYDSTQNGTTFTNTLSAMMDVRGQKIWKDNSNAYNLRPTDVTLRLYKTRDGETERTQVTATPTWTKNGNAWEYVFKNLPQFEDGIKLTYTVAEAVPENYQNEIDGFDITNTLYGKVDISGTKTWVYNDAPESARPKSITVVLLRNGTKYAEKKVTADTNTTADNPVWHFVFSNLDKYDSNGVLYAYTIEELEVDSYDTEIVETDITNTYNPTLIEIHADKVWLNDKEDERPGSIDVQLLRDGEVYEQVILNNEDGWEYTWHDLDPNYEYTVKETYRIPGYYEGVTKGDVEHGFTIENKKIPENPSTGDVVGITSAVLLASVGGTAIVMSKRRR